MDITLHIPSFLKRRAVPEPHLSREETALAVALYAPPSSEEHQGEGNSGAIP